MNSARGASMFIILAVFSLFSCAAFGQTPASGSITFSYPGSVPSDGPTGSIDLTVNGVFSCEISYQPFDLPWDVANRMAAAINGGCTTLVTAAVDPSLRGASDVPMVMTATTGGSDSDYPFSIAYRSGDFPFFTLTPSGSTLTGGADAGSIQPKYVIISVEYAPPGAASQVDYGTSSVFGSSTSTTKSFSTTNTVSISTSGGPFKGNNSSEWTATQDDSTSISIQKTTTNDIITPGPLADGIDHNFDKVWIWINPQVDFLIFAPSGQASGQYSYTNDPLDPAGQMDVQFIYLKWLKNPALMQTEAPGLLDALARRWALPPTDGSGTGLTNADYQDILKADPFGDPNYVVAVASGTQTTVDNRFDRQPGQTFPYEPPANGGKPSSEKHTFAYQTTSQVGHTATDIHKVSFSRSVDTGKFISWIDLNFQDTFSFTWTNKVTNQITTGSTQSALATIGGPSAGYQGPTDVQVYQDNIYGTFMFSFVPLPTFNLSATATSKTITPGASVNYTINTTAVSGFTDNVVLSSTVAGLPQGATASFSPATIGTPGSSTLTIATSPSTPLGTYSLVVTGTGGPDIRNVTLTLVVSPPADFTIQGSPTSVAVTAPGSATFTVTTGSQNGFTGSVNLAISGLPTGASAIFGTNPIAGGGNSLVTVSVPASTTPGNYLLTVNGTSGSLIHSTQVNLSVTAPDFSISATPSTQTVTAGGNTTYTVSTSALNGFTGSVSLGTSGLPTGATASFSPASISGSATATLTISTLSSTPAATYTITITGISSNINHSTAVLLTVNAPTGSVTISAPANSSNQSTSVRVTASATETGTMIAQMQVWDNTTGVRLGINNGSTIDQTYTLAPGTHQIIVEDLAAGTFAVIHTSSVTITVFADGVHITAPANNASITGPVHVTGFATEAATQIAQMQVWDNTTGVRLGINNGSTIDQTYTLASGTHQIIMEDLAAGTFAVIHTASVTVTVH